VAFPLMLLEYSVGSGCNLFVNTDSFFSRDEYDYPYMREYILTKRTFSAWGKLAVENNPNYCFINARLEHVYGPGDNWDKFIPKLLKDLVAGKPEIQLSTCEQRRDFIFSTDVVNAYLLLLDCGVKLSGYLDIEIGTGKSISLKDFVLAASNATRSNSSLNFGSVPQRQNEIMSSNADTSYLFSLGWKPIVELQQGLDLTLKWLHSIGR
jgi:CDP-abequose synthase